MATFAENMVAKLEALLAENPGADRVVLPDGRQVSYRDLKREWEYWKRRVAKEQGNRPAISQIDLSQTF